MRNSIRYFIIFCLSTAFLALTYNTVAYKLREPQLWMNYNRSKLEIDGIYYGLLNYSKGEGKLPDSLEQVVVKGYLPEYSPYYSCSMVNGTDYVEQLSVHYSETDYLIIFSENRVSISIPDSLLIEVGNDDPDMLKIITAEDIN